MRNTSEYSLNDALDISIRRIIHSFDMNWLFTSPAVTDKNLLEIDNGTDDYSFLFKPAHHHFTEICMCISGVMALQTGERFVELKEGCAAIILPGLIHSEIQIKKQDYLVMWLVIDTAKARLHLSGSRESEFFTSDLSFLNNCDEYNSFLDRIKSESKLDQKNSYELMKTSLLQIYILALREISAGGASYAHYFSWKESIAFEIKVFISKCGLNHLKLRDISQEICVSENHMNSIFKSVTGLTISQYIENQRIDKAKALLVNPALTINSISSQLGYYDRYHFSKVFKKSTGYTPAQFRELFIKSSLNNGSM